jgi:hypothetical protein
MTSAPAARDLHEFLEGHGFTPVKAELWAEFVIQVTAILRSAAAQLRQQDSWESFKLKRGALGAPKRRARRKLVERVPIEDALTSELAHIVRNLRRTVPEGHFLRRNEVEFHVEDLVPSPSRAGRHSRKVDFLVYAATGIDDPELAIEAKPIVAQSEIVGRYLAEEGIGCFFTEDSPYTRGPLGAMLAYTLNQDGRSWGTEIRAAVSAYVPPAIMVEDARIRGEAGSTTISRHARHALGLEPIAILHLEMLFEPEETEEAAPAYSGMTFGEKTNVPSS